MYWLECTWDISQLVWPLLTLQFSLLAEQGISADYAICIRLVMCRVICYALCWLISIKCSYLVSTDITHSAFNRPLRGFGVSQPAPLIWYSPSSLAEGNGKSAESTFDSNGMLLDCPANSEMDESVSRCELFHRARSEVRSARLVSLVFAAWRGGLRGELSAQVPAHEYFAHLQFGFLHRYM